MLIAGRRKHWLWGLALLWLAQPKLVAAQSQEEKLACVQAAGQGQTDRDEGRLLAAQRELRECARDVCPAVVRKSCAQWLEALEPRIPSVVVRVVDAAGHDVSDAHALLDGVAIELNGIPIALDPGRHQLQTSSPGVPDIERMLLLAERETARLVTVTLSPPPMAAEPTPAPKHAHADTQSSASWRIPTGAVILGGAGVLALGSFAYFAIAATNERADLKDRCGHSCTQAQTREGRGQALVADVSLGVGLASLAAATVWTVWAQRPRDSLTLVPTPGGASCQWTSRF